MRTDEALPAEWALDMAANAAGYADYITYSGRHTTVEIRKSIIAHARTLHAMEGLKEELAQFKPEPVDPDLLIARKVARGIYGQEDSHDDEAWASGLHDNSTAVKASLAALAEFKRVKGGVS